MLSILNNPTLMALDMTRRTAILEELRKEYCPSVTDDDWLSLAREIEFNRETLTKDMIGMMKRDDLHIIFTQVQERWGKRK